MIDLDRTISTDLAALATASRAPIFAISELRVFRAPAPVAGERGGLELFAIGQLYAARARRLAGGVTALLAVALLLAIDWLGDASVQWIADLSVVTMAIYVAAVVLAIRLLASGVAARRFERHVRAGDSLARARALVRHGDAAAIVTELAGAIAVAIMFGTLAFIIGPTRGWAELVTTERGWLGYHQAPVDSLNNLTVALAVVVAGAVAVGRAAPHRAWPRVFENPRVTIMAAVVLLVTMVIGMRLDVGPLLATYLTDQEPSNALRITLLATGGASTFAILAGSVLRQRRAELARLSC